MNKHDEKPPPIEVKKVPEITADSTLDDARKWAVYWGQIKRLQNIVTFEPDSLEQMKRTEAVINEHFPSLKIHFRNL